MERYKDLNTQLKLAKVFKAVISAGLVAPVFVSVSACEKAKPVIEEAQTTATIPTTIETTSPTTQEIVAPTTETIPPAIEYEGVIIHPIEGLRFDNQSGTFLAKVNNPYGLEAETKAGEFIKDAIEINGALKNSIALRPEVIEYMQKKIMEENKEFRYPLPFDLQKAKGIKITEIEDKSLANDPKLKDVLWDKSEMLAISNISLGTIVYSPASTPRLGIVVTPSMNDQYDFYNLVKFYNNKQSNNNQYDLDYNGSRIDSALIGMIIVGAQIIPPELIERFSNTGDPSSWLSEESRIGEPLVKIKEKYFLNPNIVDAEKNDEFSMVMYLQMEQWKLSDNKEVCTGFVQTGLPSLITTGDKEKKEEIIVSFMPANE